MTARRLTPFAVYSLWLLLIVGFALLPLIGAIGASMIGRAAGCRVDEGGRYACVILGSDIGEMLATLFVMGWLMFVTMPIGALLLLIWLVVIALHVIRVRRRHG